MHKRVKNVIIVDDTADNFGGTAQIAYITAVVLRDCGYNVVYFAGCGPIRLLASELCLKSSFRSSIFSESIELSYSAVGACV